MHGNLQIMATRRKRMAQREPNGKPSRAGQEREFPPTQVKRLRDAAMQGLREPEWGTELGRLYLNEVITSPMYAAGKRWREWAATYHRAIGMFPVRSASVEFGRGGSAPDPDSDAGRKIAQREADGAERFFAAHATLMIAGDQAEKAVRALCECDQMPDGFEQMMKLRKGLLALVVHWDLTGSGKSDKRDVR